MKFRITIGKFRCHTGLAATKWNLLGVSAALSESSRMIKSEVMLNSYQLIVSMKPCASQSRVSNL
jgi:hypothetical protein